MSDERDPGARRQVLLAIYRGARPTCSTGIDTSSRRSRPSCFRCVRDAGSPVRRISDSGTPPPRPRLRHLDPQDPGDVRLRYGRKRRRLSTNDRASAHLGELSVISLGFARLRRRGDRRRHARRPDYILRKTSRVFSRIRDPPGWRAALRAARPRRRHGRDRQHTIAPGDFGSSVDVDGIVVVPGSGSDEILAEAKDKVATENDPGHGPRRNAPARGLERSAPSSSGPALDGCGTIDRRRENAHRRSAPPGCPRTVRYRGEPVQASPTYSASSPPSASSERPRQSQPPPKLRATRPGDAGYALPIGPIRPRASSSAPRIFPPVSATRGIVSQTPPEPHRVPLPDLLGRPRLESPRAERPPARRRDLPPTERRHDGLPRGRAGAGAWDPCATYLCLPASGTRHDGAWRPPASRRDPRAVFDGDPQGGVSGGSYLSPSEGLRRRENASQHGSAALRRRASAQPPPSSSTSGPGLRLSARPSPSRPASRRRGARSPAAAAAASPPRLRRRVGVSVDSTRLGLGLRQDRLGASSAFGSASSASGSRLLGVGSRSSAFGSGSGSGFGSSAFASSATGSGSGAPGSAAASARRLVGILGGLGRQRGLQALRELAQQPLRDVLDHPAAPEAGQRPVMW